MLQAFRERVAWAALFSLPDHGGTAPVGDGLHRVVLPVPVGQPAKEATAPAANASKDMAVVMRVVAGSSPSRTPRPRHIGEAKLVQLWPLADTLGRGHVEALDVAAVGEKSLGRRREKLLKISCCFYLAGWGRTLFSAAPRRRPAHHPAGVVPRSPAIRYRPPRRRPDRPGSMFMCRN